MNKKIIGIVCIVSLIVIGFLLLSDKPQKEEKAITAVSGTVIRSEPTSLTIQDKDHIIYTFSLENSELSVGDVIKIEYDGNLNKNKEKQAAEVLNYKTVSKQIDNDGIPRSFQDNGLFSDYYNFAKEKLDTMTLDEKIGQLLLVRYPDSNATNILNKYQFGGYVFFEKDFKNKTKSEVIKMMNNLQASVKIPILTATDEEGGAVVRVSSNSNLAPEKFKSSKELYTTGGFEMVKEDTINKSKLLYSLGLNLNLAPVVDVSTNPSDYMYKRALGENTETTSKYAQTVIEASKGYGVSYTLKHFPGYGNNSDTHSGVVTDNRPYDDIVKNDLPPFEAGIDVGAEAILISHNVVTNIDSNNPASLSPSVHNLLRHKLGFTGIIITDDLDMGALSSIDNPTVKAILAGNDLIITTNYSQSINEIKAALNDGTLTEDLIDKLAFRVLAWKYYKGLITKNQK